MKKLLLGSFLIANIMMMTSCLDDGGSSEIENVVVGVMKFDLKAVNYLFYFSDEDYPMNLGSTVTTSLNENDCVAVAFTLREADNPDVYNTGYYNVLVRDYAVIPKGYVTGVDTANIRENEMPAIDVTYGGYAQGYLFLSSTHESVGDKQKSEYEVSYDFNQEPVKDNNGKNIYNLFLRAKKLEDGTSPITTRSITNAFYAGQFINHVIEKEKAENSSEDYAYFQINYIRSFDKDSVPTWTKASQAFGVRIIKESSN